MSAVDEIKQRLDIADVVSDYAALSRSGQNFKARCPFHVEKTPSFFVFPDRQTWHCFGACASGGDVFTFIMKAEGLSFGEALGRLAARAGVSLERTDRGTGPIKDRLFEVNAAAVAYYHQVLMEAPVAERARAYVARRGLTPKTLVDFRLGYSLPAQDALMRHLDQLGFGRDEMAAAGVIIEGEQGWRDRFHDRLMFPIRDGQGRTVGFGARVLDDGLPKYLNSPQTPVFDKSGLLYGLDRARPAIQKEKMAVIVEGYMDVITAHQNGFQNVVASMGTSLTERQLGLLRRLECDVALALDSDAAGQAATRRGLQLARETMQRQVLPVPTWLGASSLLETQIKVFVLPQGQDPDAVIRDDPAAWEALVARALPLAEYLFGVAVRSHDVATIQGRSAAVNELLPLIAEVADPIQRELYLSRLAKLVGVGERTLQESVAGLRRADDSKRRQRRPPQRPEAPASSVKPWRDALEEHCLLLLLGNPVLLGRCSGLSAEHFEQAENRELLLALSLRLADWRQGLEAALIDHGERLLSQRLPPLSEKAREQALGDCIRRLEERRLRRLKQQEELLIAEAEASGDINEMAEAAYALLRDEAVPEDQTTEQGELRYRGIGINARMYQLFLETRLDSKRGDKS